jgi:Transposase DDE domain
VQENMGQLPEKASADTGFFSEANLTAKAVAGVDLSVPPERSHHTTPGTSAPAATSAEDSVREQMRHKLNRPEGQAVYKMRKAIVEPGFGQIKDGRGFRRFSFRGLVQVGAEWTLICLTHNLLKLFRGRRGFLAA